MRIGQQSQRTYSAPTNCHFSAVRMHRHRCGFPLDRLRHDDAVVTSNDNLQKKPCFIRIRFWIVWKKNSTNVVDACYEARSIFGDIKTSWLRRELHSSAIWKIGLIHTLNFFLHAVLIFTRLNCHPYVRVLTSLTNSWSSMPIVYRRSPITFMSIIWFVWPLPWMTSHMPVETSQKPENHQKLKFSQTYNHVCGQEVWSN